MKIFNFILFKFKLYSLVNYKYFFNRGFKNLTKFAKFVVIIRIFHFIWRFIGLINLIFVIFIFLVYTKFDNLLLFVGAVVKFYKYFYDQLFNKYYNLLRIINNWIENQLNNVDNVNLNKTIDKSNNTIDEKPKLDKNNKSKWDFRKNTTKNIPVKIEVEQDYLKRTNDYKNVEINTSNNNSNKKYYYIVGLIILVIGGVGIYYFSYGFEDFANNFLIRNIIETEMFDSENYTPDTSTSGTLTLIVHLFQANVL